MNYRLLISGYRDSFTVVHFDPSAKSISIEAEYPAPSNASWVELLSAKDALQSFVGLSEGEDKGLLYSFEIDHGQKKSQITRQQPTLGAPAHFIKLRDDSALALATYFGGSVDLFRFSTQGDSFVLSDENMGQIIPGFAYRDDAHGPDAGRQEQSHVHQVIEDKRGLLYAADLGSDRVWVISRQASKMSLCGWLQCPPGTGPRHAVISPDENTLFVLGELSHTVIAFDISTSPGESHQPIDGFAVNIVPPSIPPHHQGKMDSAEICLHPSIPNVLYVSNRWARHISKLMPQLTDVPSELPPGDSVAIILLSDDGRTVEGVKHVLTNVDVIRGMRLSDDGKYAIVLGQEGGGVEVYEIGGARGDAWTRVAALRDGLGTGLAHAVWL